MTSATCVVGCAVLVACGGSPSARPDAAVDAAPREVVAETRSLLVGELGEGILTGGPGDLVSIQLTAPTATLDWNIHGHPGSTTITVVEGLAQTSVAYVFSPTDQADWFLLIRNHGTVPMDVTVRLELYGAVTWSGWQ